MCVWESSVTNPTGTWVIQCGGVTKKKWGVGPEGKDKAKGNCVYSTTVGGNKDFCAPPDGAEIWFEAPRRRGMDKPGDKNLPYLKAEVTECRLYPDDVEGDELTGGQSCAPLKATTSGTAKTFRITRAYIGSAQASMGWNPSIPKTQRRGQEFAPIADCKNATIPSAFFGDGRKHLDQQGKDTSNDIGCGTITPVESSKCADIPKSDSFLWLQSHFAGADRPYLFKPGGSGEIDYVHNDVGWIYKGCDTGDVCCAAVCRRTPFCKYFEQRRTDCYLFPDMQCTGFSEAIPVSMADTMCGASMRKYSVVPATQHYWPESLPWFWGKTQVGAQNRIVWDQRGYWVSFGTWYPGINDERTTYCAKICDSMWNCGHYTQELVTFGPAFDQAKKLAPTKMWKCQLYSRGTCAPIKPAAGMIQKQCEFQPYFGLGTTELAYLVSDAGFKSVSSTGSAQSLSQCPLHRPMHSPCHHVACQICGVIVMSDAQKCHVGSSAECPVGLVFPSQKFRKQAI